jgi:predicted nucleic-acid-binding protein
MKAIDTNVLVRFLVNDDVSQARLVRQYFNTVEKQRETLFVPLLVVAETIWVLESAYGIEREAIISVLNELVLLPILEFENREVIQRAMSSAKHNRFDLADLLIAEIAHLCGCQSVLTFDKKAVKNERFELIN